MLREHLYFFSVAQFFGFPWRLL